MIRMSGLEVKAYRMTAEGLAELQQQLQELKRQRMAVAAEMREIASQTTDMGALEDSTLAINQNQAAEIDGQIALLERIIGLAEVIERPADNRTVHLGSHVTVSLDGTERSYVIVGPVEADPLDGKISDESPLGRSLLGKKVRDTVEIISPARRRTSAAIMAIM